MNTCNICSKTFNSLMALTGHKRIHGASNGVVVKQQFTIEIAGFTYHGTRQRIDAATEYHKKPDLCKCCSKILKYRYDNSQFCNKSCSASYTNKLRPPMSENQKIKVSRSLKTFFLDHPSSHPKINRDEIVNVKNKQISIKIPRIKTKTLLGKTKEGMLVLVCHHCKENFISRNRSKYCPDHKELYKSNGRNRYTFNFNIYEYPDLFNIRLIKEKGWHSYGGRFNYNPEGLTRDHKVSINESIKNNYDPYYIRHPLNCEIMTFKENNKKKTRSSILYSELVKLVDEYDKRT